MRQLSLFGDDIRVEAAVPRRKPDATSSEMEYRRRINEYYNKKFAKKADKPREYY